MESIRALWESTYLRPFPTISMHPGVSQCSQNIPMRTCARACLEGGAMSKALHSVYELDELREVTIQVILLSWEWLHCLRNSYIPPTLIDEPYAISDDVLEDSLKEVTLKKEKSRSFCPVKFKFPSVEFIVTFRLFKMFINTTVHIWGVKSDVSFLRTMTNPSYPTCCLKHTPSHARRMVKVYLSVTANIQNLTICFSQIRGIHF